MRLIQAGDFGLASAVTLSEAVGRGDWVVITGDRVSLKHEDRAVDVDFLGSPASFPQGPFVLAAALHCPVYVLVCWKDAGRHQVLFKCLSEGFSAPRQGRAEALKRTIEDYAHTLEQVIRSAPYQWFNFYDYWSGAAARTR